MRSQNECYKQEMRQHRCLWADVPGVLNLGGKRQQTERGKAPVPSLQMRTPTWKKVRS